MENVWTPNLPHLECRRISRSKEISRSKKFSSTSSLARPHNQKRNVDAFETADLDLAYFSCGSLVSKFCCAGLDTRDPILELSNIWHHSTWMGETAWDLLVLLGIGVCLAYRVFQQKPVGTKKHGKQEI